jgi:nucleotide sugar dehydrogenase
MQIGIIGLGFVGYSMFRSFQMKDVDVTGYDKFNERSNGTFADILKTDIVFLCLPTKYDESINKYNKDAIHETCGLLDDVEYEGTVVIKSTVEPQTTELFAKKYKLNFIHNPEFLTARTAFEDFHNQKHIVLGRATTCPETKLDELVDFYSKYWQDAEVSVCMATESESMKSFVNCYYSVKIQFFNELYSVCQKSGTDYAVVKDLMLRNGWINPMHTDVPGPDGQLSYGGLCFPKDTNALLQYMKSIGSEHMVLEAVVKERNVMRDDHDNVMK